MLLTACRKNTATSGQSTQNLCSTSQHHQAFTADSWCTKHSKKKKKIGDYIMLLYLSMGSDLRDFHMSDDRWNYSCEGCYWGLALTNCHLSRTSESVLISFSSCDVSMLTTSNFLRLNSTTLSLWKRGCLSRFWKASERMHGSNLKEQAQGGHFFYWGWSFILRLVSSSERYNCRVGEKE